VNTHFILERGNGAKTSGWGCSFPRPPYHHPWLFAMYTNITRMTVATYHKIFTYTMYYILQQIDALNV